MQCCVSEQFINSMIAYAFRFVHAPYVYGGNGAGINGQGIHAYGGFDCSGFVIEVLQAFDVIGPGDWTAQGLYDKMLPQSDTETIPDKGALMFFGKSTKEITHVALAINRYQMIEAGGGGSDSTTPANSTGFVRVRPQDFRDDLVAVLTYISKV